MPEVFSNVLSQLGTFERKHKSIICYVYALLASVFFTTMNFFVKSLSNLSSAEILFYRSIELYGLTALMMKSQKMEFHFSDPKINRLLLSRGVIGLIAMSLNFYGIRLLPLSEASVVSQTTPVIVGVLATIFLNEKYELSQFWGALFCMSGVLLVVKPEFLFPSNEEKTETDNDRFVGVMALLTGTIFVSTTQVLVKKIGAKTNEGVVTLYFAAISSILSPILALFQGFNSFGLSEALILILVGFFSFGGQMMRNKSYILGNPGKVSIMSYFGIIYSLFLDVYVLGSEPDIYSLLGALCIFCSLFVFLYQIIKKEKQKK